MEWWWFDQGRIFPGYQLRQSCKSKLSEEENCIFLALAKLQNLAIQSKAFIYNTYLEEFNICNDLL